MTGKDNIVKIIMKSRVEVGEIRLAAKKIAIKVSHEYIWKKVLE